MDIFLSISALIFFFLLFSISKRLLQKRKNLPPSPPSLPILAHLHLLKKPLHHYLTTLSNRYGPILSLRFGSRPVLIISSPSLAEDCFSKNDIIFANRPRLLAGKHFGSQYSSLSWASYGPHWRNIRRIATVEILSSNRIQMFSAVRIQEVQSLMKDLFRDSESGKTVVELKSRLSELTFNVMMGMIAGKRYYGENVVDLEEARRFREIISQGSMLIGTPSFGDFVPVLGWLDFGGVEKRMVRLVRWRDEFLQALIDEHRRRKKKVDSSLSMEVEVEVEVEKKKKTFIDVLLSLQETEPEYYTDQIIKGMLSVILASLSTKNRSSCYVVFQIFRSFEVPPWAIWEDWRLHRPYKGEFPTQICMNGVVFELCDQCMVFRLRSTSSVSSGSCDLPELADRVGDASAQLPKLG